MKKSLLFFAVAALTLFTACNKTVPAPDELSCNPNPLTVVGNEVNADITGTFPAKKFVKKGILEVTPVLKYGNEEVLGESVTYVGEKAKVNGKTVNYKKGGSYKQHFSCGYKPGMEKSELYLRFKATVGKKTITIPDLKVADGMITTSKMSEAKDVVCVVTPDKFQRIIEDYQEADIKFLINQSQLRSSESKSQSLADLRAAIKDADAADNKVIAGLEVTGYASPDGELGHNEKLAKQRQAVAEKFLAKQLKKDKISADIESEITAEDWAGFQKLMEGSNIQDKELVLRVLSMYQDPEEREAQIKNLAAVYKNIADDILPELRRSRLVLTTNIIGRSDDEILALAKENPAALSVEELLYAATLVKDCAGKKAMYQKVVELHPGEYRGWNNLGLCQFAEGNVAEARRSYAKALAIDSKNADVNFNAGLAAMAEGDLQKAEEFLGKAAGTKGNLPAAMGTLATMKGDYKAAAKQFSGVASNNAAIQQILNEDYAAARKTLASVENPNATTAYLQAVVAARQNDKDGVYAGLKAAVAKDASLKAKAARDIEFAKFAEDATFLSIVK